MTHPSYRQLAALFALALSGWASFAVAAETRAPRPNILFILADDHRADGIAALSNPRLKTPTLDKLVGQGVSFSRAYIMGSMEGAVCAPSRCMMQTGRSLFHLPPTNLRKSYPEFAAAMKDKTEGADWALLPRVMRANGYATFHIGKRGNECVPSLDSYDLDITHNDPKPEERARSSQVHADGVIDYLRNRKTDKPFFIYLAPPVPHDPRVAAPEFMHLYQPADVLLPASFLPVHPFDNGEMIVRDEQLAPWPRTPDNIRRQLADYYACITGLDHHLGRVMDCLKDLGQLTNTYIIFAGDNGLSLGEHGLMGKQNLYEYGGMHVPLVIAGPGIQRGQSDAFVYLYDLFPTICDFARAPVPAAAEGQSLLPILTGRPAKQRDYLFTAYKDVQRAVRTDRWKLIRYPQVDQTQLFDLQNDPHELNNLAAKPEQAAKVKEMLALLAKAQKECGDPAPLTVANPKPAKWSPPDNLPAKKAKSDS
ncbi:MAG: sulfatase-like hydrolase/transferase [Verrucomicrobiota bacterium]